MAGRGRKAKDSTLPPESSKERKREDNAVQAEMVRMQKSAAEAAETQADIKAQKLLDANVQAALRVVRRPGRKRRPRGCNK